jgi:glycosyltransferase involved in cell wall biosynthesis
MAGTGAMRILFLSTVYPQADAPVRGTFNRELCRALSAQGHSLRVIAPRPWPELLRDRGPQNPAVDEFPVIRPTFIYPPKLLRHTYGSWMWHSIRRQTERQIRELQPEWVVSYWAHPDGEAGYRAARMAGAKAAVLIGGSDVLLLPKDRRRRLAIQRVLRESDAIITVCDGLRQPVLELGAEPHRVQTIYQGINERLLSPGDPGAARERLGLPADVPVYLWVGRMVGLKRLDVLLKAFQSVRQSQPDAHLCLVGSGPLKASLQREVMQTGLTASVTFAGAVEPHSVADWYRAASATVLTSDSEGLPNVLRESLACGTPWVATRVGSVEELAVPECAVLVDRGDSQGLAEAMLQILEPVYRLGAAAQRPRSWTETAQTLVSCLESRSGGSPSNCSTGDRPAEAGATLS